MHAMFNKQVKQGYNILLQSAYVDLLKEALRRDLRRINVTLWISETTRAFAWQDGIFLPKKVDEGKLGQSSPFCFSLSITLCFLSLSVTSAFVFSLSKKGMQPFSLSLNALPLQRKFLPLRWARSKLYSLLYTSVTNSHNFY